MSQPELARKVLVLGNVASGVALVPLSKAPDDPGATASPHARYTDLYRRHWAWIGAPTLCKMIDAALGARPGEIAPNPCADLANLPVQAADCRELTTVLASYPAKSSSTGPSVERVMRVQASFFTIPSGTEEACENMRRYLESAMRDAAHARIVVVYERDREFGDVFKRFVAAKPSFEPDVRRALVISLADHISETALSQAIAFGHGGTPDRSRIVGVVTAEALRHRGLNIVEYGSIERTVRDIVHYAGRNPLAKILELCGHVVVVFEDTGAIYLRRDAGGNIWTGSVHFCPNFDRVAQRDPETYGRTPGRREIALAAIVSQIDDEMTRRPGEAWNLADAVRLGLAAHNLHFKKGFDADKSPFETFEQILGNPRRKQLQELIDGTADKKHDTEFLLSSLQFRVNEDDLKTWSRIHAVIPLSADAATVRDRLREIVTQGPEQPFRATARPAGDPWFPGSTIKCPYFRIGKIKTADSAEIEGFANLIELFRRYLRDQDWTAPLSIGVFGPPGTGKSFAVKELMKTVNPEAKDTLTYNLAQFNSVELLTEAFHQVQDRALASDEVPLVMFDEFDTKFDGTPLGWLKYFLAPMQDGMFRGRSADYRVGRAIFVFSGGTEDSYDDFDKVKPPKKDDTATNAARSAPTRSDTSASEPEARAVKLNDFISRLKGHMTISDINPPRHRATSFAAPESDEARLRRMVRRAMVLRSLLEQFAKPIMQSGPEVTLARIRPEVIDAFMNVEQYRHGVRSMESVIRMSRWIDGYFLPASLPARDQLDMHAPGFLDRVAEARSGAVASAMP